MVLRFIRLLLLLRGKGTAGTSACQFFKDSSFKFFYPRSLENYIDQYNAVTVQEYAIKIRTIFPNMALFNGLLLLHI